MVLYSKIKKIFQKDSDKGIENKEAKTNGKSAVKNGKDEEAYDTSPKLSEQKEEGKASDKKESRKKSAAFANKIILMPLVSEKSSILAEASKYCFIVDCKTNKSEISKAVQTMYGIKPIKINIVNMLGKSVRFGRRSGSRKNWKKAVVHMPKGTKLEIYEGV